MSEEEDTAAAEKEAALQARLENPAPVATDPQPTTTYHPMELPANPAARAQFPEHLIDKSPDAAFSSSIQDPGGDYDAKLLTAMKARAEFDQPEPKEWELPHLEKGQSLLDAETAAAEEAEAKRVDAERANAEDAEKMHADEAPVEEAPA